MRVFNAINATESVITRRFRRNRLCGGGKATKERDGKRVGRVRVRAAMLFVITLMCPFVLRIFNN